MTARVVFVGDLGTAQYFSGESRCRAIEQQGHDVVRFDTASWGGTTPWTYRINHRLFCGRGVREINRHLEEVVARNRPDVVWVDKGLWIYPSTLRQIRRSTRFIVHYSTDDILASVSQNWMHRHVTPLFDLYLTTNRFNVVEIPNRYGTRCLRVGMGLDHERQHAPGGTAVNDLVNGYVAFVGHWEPSTESVVSALLADGLPCKIWGANWRKARNPVLRATETLPASEYIRVLRSGGIGLCCLSKWERNESTGRSFEIPAIGAALVAEKTAEHEFLYEDGKEAFLFSDAEEAVNKVRLLLDDISQLYAIAAAGLARCTSLGLSWADHLAREWPIIERLLEGGEICPQDDDPFWPGFRAGHAYSGPERSTG